MRPARQEASTSENLRLARPRVESVNALSVTYSLTTTFNATAPTNMATVPSAWEQHPCLILLFTDHSGMGGEKATTIHATSSTVLPSTPPRRARRQPPHPGFLGLGLICSPSTPSATSRPGLNCGRSTKELRPQDDYRGSHARHRTRGLSPSRHRRHHDILGTAGVHRRTSLQQPLQRHRSFTSKAPP
jgi:hypothetical protein